MPRQEKISRVVRIGQKAGGANCNSASTLETSDPVEMSPNLPKTEDHIVSQHFSDCSPPKEETEPRQIGTGVKRPAPKKSEESLDFSGEMRQILESFGSDINKTLSAKKQRLENLTTTSLKATNKKVEDLWKQQQVERQKLYDDFQKQTLSVLQQWELDLEKVKENEEKLTNLLRQQQKLFQQMRVIQSQRLRTIKELHEQFAKGLDELEKNQLDFQRCVQGQLQKEMAFLQKKILVDTQQQEMASVRKSLQTMLF